MSDQSEHGDGKRGQNIVGVNLLDRPPVSEMGMILFEHNDTKSSNIYQVVFVNTGSGGVGMSLSEATLLSYVRY